MLLSTLGRVSALGVRRSAARCLSRGCSASVTRGSLLCRPVCRKRGLQIRPALLCARFSGVNGSPVGTDRALAAARAGIAEGASHYTAGNFAASEVIFRKVLEQLIAGDTGHSREHLIFQSATKLNLANAIREQYRAEPAPKQFTEADSMYRQAIKTIRTVYGEQHIRLCKALREHAMLLQMVGDVAEVESVVRDAIAVHIVWSKAVAASTGNSVTEVTEERAAQVVECRERVELLVMLARALQAQGKTAEVAQLEEPIYKCIERVEMVDTLALPDILQDLAAYQEVAGIDNTKTLEALEMLAAQAVFIQNEKNEGK